MSAHSTTIRSRATRFAAAMLGVVTLGACSSTSSSLRPSRTIPPADTALEGSTVPAEPSVVEAPLPPLPTSPQWSDPTFVLPEETDPPAQTTKPRRTTTLPTVVPTVPETIPETVPETIPETVPETIPETVPETIPETIPETVPETIPETVPETIPETVPETIPETVPATDPPATDPTTTTSTTVAETVPTIPETVPATDPPATDPPATDPPATTTTVAPAPPTGGGGGIGAATIGTSYTESIAQASAAFGSAGSAGPSGEFPTKAPGGFTDGQRTFAKKFSWSHCYGSTCLVFGSNTNDPASSTLLGWTETSKNGIPTESEGIKVGHKLSALGSLTVKNSACPAVATAVTPDGVTLVLVSTGGPFWTDTPDTPADPQPDPDLVKVTAMYGGSAVQWSNPADHCSDPLP